MSFIAFSQNKNLTNELKKFLTIDDLYFLSEINRFFYFITLNIDFGNHFFKIYIPSFLKE